MHICARDPIFISSPYQRRLGWPNPGISRVHPLIEYKARQSAQNAKIQFYTVKRGAGERRLDARVSPPFHYKKLTITALADTLPFAHDLISCQALAETLALSRYILVGSLWSLSRL